MRAPTTVVVLAAGRGTRMRSALPKVLQPLAGRPLLSHVLDTAFALEPVQVRVVYGAGGEKVRARHADAPVAWDEQAEQLGTGHAVGCAIEQIPDDHRVVILYGDVPLVTAGTLAPLLDAPLESLALLTAQLTDPSGYGRVVRDTHGRVDAVVEERDASAEQRRICEINTGLMAAPAAALRRWLKQLSADNAQGEYYLTDCVAAATAEGRPVSAHTVSDPDEVAGVNDLLQLAAIERLWQQRTRSALMRAGVRMPAPERVQIRGELIHATDCVVDADVIIEGRVELGRAVTLGQGAVVRESRIGDGATILPYTVLDEVEIGAGCRLGPFAHLRPGSRLDAEARVGNFVEIKASRLSCGAKANHLSYIGDAVIGERVNIGAGTITCNYDGANKHATQVNDDAFIGSGTQLVAPVTVGRAATIGAGTTVTRDVPDGALALTRSRQRTVSDWQRPGLTPCRGDTDDSPARSTQRRPQE